MHIDNNGYGCSHPDQEHRDSDNGRGQCFAFSCPLAWRLHPDQEEEDAEIAKKHGWDPGDDDLLCLNVDIHDENAITDGGGIWWRVAGVELGDRELESSSVGSVWESRHVVRLACDRSNAEGKTLGEAIKNLQAEFVTP